MHWTEPASADDSHSDLENRLWAAANQLWANAALKPSEFSPIVLGLIFLRFADVRFSANGAFTIPSSYVKVRPSIELTTQPVDDRRNVSGARVAGRKSWRLQGMIAKAAYVMGIVALGFAGGGAVAQESTNRVAANTDWSVFVEENPKECWSVSKPKSTVNTRDGEVANNVTRGEILLFVSFRPGATGEVAFTGGYPFAEDSTVSVKVGGSEFQLFVDGEWAWTRSPEDDAAIIAAMKAGADAVVTGVSSRGTKTEDTFSLLGFTAAVDDAGQRCK